MAPGLVILGLGMVSGFGSYVVSLLTTMQDQAARIKHLEDELASAQAPFDALSSRRAEMVHLAPASGDDGLTANVLWDPVERNALIRLGDVDSSDTSYLYRLWTLDSSGPSAVTTFRITTLNSFSLYVRTLPGNNGGATDIAVTKHPPGGAHFQEGTLVLTGTLRG